MSFSWAIEIHDTLESTQATLKDMALKNASEGTVVQALQQTKGKGRYEREWVSEEGNLFFSLLIRPSCPAHSIGPLSLLTGLAVAKAIQPYLDEPESLVLKWPNDILLVGKKCAGILLETEIGADQNIEWVVVGIGINVSSAPPDLGICLGDHVQSSVDLNTLRDDILAQFDLYYSLWRREGIEKIRTFWLETGHEKDTPVQVKMGDEFIEGRFFDIDKQGNMLLHDNAGQLRKITAGEVYI